jgi:F0F1-type ATP synthase epsilon subunit
MLMMLSFLAHVPSIEQLAPGLLEVVESSGTKKWFGE